MLEKLLARMRGGKENHAIVQMREAIEGGLQEIAGPMRSHILAHREDFQDESVCLAAIRRMR